MTVNVNVTDGKTADKKGVYDIPLLGDSVIVADRFYNDFSLFNISGSSQVNFVVRNKENLQYCSIKEYGLREGRHQHILKDECMELTGNKSKKIYPFKLGNRNAIFIIHL